MEKRTIRSGAPYLVAGGCVLAEALIFGMGGPLGYLAAAAFGVAGFVVGSKLFPDRVIEVESAPKSGNAEVDALIREARAQLDDIARANDAIAEPQLSAQIDDIESTCRLILQRLEEQPGMLSSLRTFLRYYLPATRKLLDARAKLENEVNAGQNEKIAGRIREAMATVQQAFHKQLDALTEFRFINLESEMDVLTDMLRSDGLADDALDMSGIDTTKRKQADGEDPFAGLFTTK